MTGIYLATNLGETEPKWTRLTPPPDGPECYSYFNGFSEFDNYREIYAFGWQGIDHYQQGIPWEVELKTHLFPMNDVIRRDAVNMDVWAVAGGGGADPPHWASAQDHGAIFRYTQSTARWERVPIPQNFFDHPRQGLNAILVDPNVNYIIAVGGSGLILRGEQVLTNWVWTKIPSGTEQPLTSIARGTDFNPWIVGNNGVVLWSPDDGHSWKEYPCLDEQGIRLRSNLNRIRFLGHEGWITAAQTLLRCKFP
jgi:hypothetical protein